MIRIPSYSQENKPWKDEDLVCYCFGYTRKDIEKDYVNNGGGSKILERIVSETKDGKCDCAQKNPKRR
ncbi:MAG TPA: BFD-like (2Fe-2S) protein [Deltaproteobacteria bacterium]|nr:BFD-like (2Fe-2S) protein [Deltaproteobacteria bacterium]